MAAPSNSNRRRRFSIFRRRSFTAVPIKIAVKLPPQPQRRKSNPIRFPRTKIATVTPPQIVVTVSTVPVATKLKRNPLAFRPRRGFTTTPIAPVIVTVTQTLPAQPAKKFKLRPVLRRSFTTTPIVSVVVAIPVQPARKIKPPFRSLVRRGFTATPAIPVVVTVQALPPQQQINRVKLAPFVTVPRIRRRVNVLPATVTIVVQPATRLKVRPLLRRGFTATAPAIVVIVNTTQALPPQPARRVKIPVRAMRRTSIVAHPYRFGYRKPSTIKQFVLVRQRLQLNPDYHKYFTKGYRIG